MEKTYAQALSTMIEGGTSPKEAVAALRRKLIAEGRENLLPRIAGAFRRIAEREMRKHEIVLSLARAKDERSAKSSAKASLKQLKVSADDLAVTIDDTIIGGWRLEGRGELIDASWKKHLLSIYNRATR